MLYLFLQLQQNKFPNQTLLRSFETLYYLLKRKKNINHLYAFRKEQHIKNNYHNFYDYQDVIKSFLLSF